MDWSRRGYHAQRWAARGALLAAALAVATPLVYGGLRGLALLVLGVVGLALSAAAVWWTLTLRGPLRWAAAVVAVCVAGGGTADGAELTTREDAALEQRLHLIGGQIDADELDRLPERDVGEPQLTCGRRLDLSAHPDFP